MTTDELRDEIETLFKFDAKELPDSAGETFTAFRNALSSGTVRAATPSIEGWQTNAWVKKGILVGFRVGRSERTVDAGPLGFVDKHTLPTRRFDDDEGVRGGVDIPADEAHPAETPAWPEEMAAQMRARARTQREGTERRWEIERGGAPGYDGPRGMEEGDEDEAMEDARTEGNTPTSAPATAHEDQDDDMASLIQDLQCMEMIGSISHSCNTGGRRRDLRRGLRRMVSEIYSPPRVTKMLSAMPNRLLAPGLALDITCIDPDDGKPWDFDQKDKRDKALKMLRRQKPLFLIGSPMCTAWCAWQ